MSVAPSESPRSFRRRRSVSAARGTRPRLGKGIDVLLSTRRVGPTSKVYGLDMTDAMLALARENQRKAGVQNMEFLKGEIENIPLPDNSVDVIISNCVINLSGDKDRVLQETFRVLKPSGRFAVSDVVTRGEVPVEIREKVLLWVGCIAGALRDEEYRGKLVRAGFQSIDIEPTRVYAIEDARGFLADKGVDVDALAPQVEGKFMRAFIRAVKPPVTSVNKTVETAARQPAVHDRARMQLGLLMSDRPLKNLFLCTHNSDEVDHRRVHPEPDRSRKAQRL